MHSEGFRLYAKPSFWEGVARLIDISGTLDEYNYSDSEIEADYRALESDWEEVGQDIQTALEMFDKNIQGQRNQ